MLIEENALQHWIDNFYGYGSWRARFWFIAHEEGGGEIPEEVADRLRYFEKVQAQADGTLCDIRELYKHVAVSWDGPRASSFNNLYEYRFGKTAVQHGVWKNLIAFVHGYKGEVLPDLLAYQKDIFASPSLMSEALMRLYPLPAPHNHGWYYSWLGLDRLPFLKTRTLYQEHLYQRRIRVILSNMRMHKPEILLMYGMQSITRLKDSVEQFFPGAKFKMIKAIKRKVPQYHRADVNGTTILITTQIPALRHNRIETGFDWEELGRSISLQNK